jgi:hypothetical protein
MKPSTTEPPKHPPEAPPPFLRSWGRVYLIVIAELAALTGLFYALTRWAS